MRYTVFINIKKSPDKGFWFRSRNVDDFFVYYLLINTSHMPVKPTNFKSKITLRKRSNII